jgi:hypothetical protein
LFGFGKHLNSLPVRQTSATIWLIKPNRISQMSADRPAIMIF